MVQLCVHKPGQAGAPQPDICEFPCTIGRAATDTLRLNEPGVWDHHLQLDLQVPDGFRLRRLGQGRACVNGAEFDDLILRNGDVVELGAVKVQFWLSAVIQRGMWLRELLTWLGLGVLAVLQGVLVSLLL